MSKKKIKVGNLSLNQIIKLAEKYKGNCTECPLGNICFIDCFDFCEGDNTFKRDVKKEFKKEIEVDVK